MDDKGTWSAAGAHDDSSVSHAEPPGRAASPIERSGLDPKSDGGRKTYHQNHACGDDSQRLQASTAACSIDNLKASCPGDDQALFGALASSNQSDAEIRAASKPDALGLHKERADSFSESKRCSGSCGLLDGGDGSAQPAALQHHDQPPATRAQ